MRIVFMGTPDFAVPSFEKLIEKGHEVCAVFCQPDKPKGRGHKLQIPPVKEAALQHNIPVFQVDSLRKPEIQQKLRDINPDVIVVAAYGKMLPKEVLEIPAFGCINVHGSLLPAYRGAAPIQRAVLNGDKVTGVTIMFMAEGMDTGDIISTKKTEIGEQETAGELFDRLKEIGADLLVETLENIQQGNFERIVQEEEVATYAPMLSKQESEIDWSKSAHEIHNQIRGLNPWPSAISFLDGKKIKIHRSEIVLEQGEAGKAKNINGDFIVYCGKHALKLIEIQPENGKRMNGKSYLLGHPLQPDSWFTKQEKK